MKKKYEKPMLLVEDFIANESVATTSCRRVEIPYSEVRPQEVNCFSGMTDSNIFYTNTAGCSYVAIGYKTITETYYFKDKQSAKMPLYNFIKDGANATMVGEYRTTANSEYNFAVGGGKHYLAWGETHAGEYDIYNGTLYKMSY